MELPAAIEQQCTSIDFALLAAGAAEVVAALAFDAEQEAVRIGRCLHGQIELVGRVAHVAQDSVARRCKAVCEKIRDGIENLPGEVLLATVRRGEMTRFAALSVR